MRYVWRAEWAWGGRTRIVGFLWSREWIARIEVVLVARVLALFPACRNGGHYVVREFHGAAGAREWDRENGGE